MKFVATVPGVIIFLTNLMNATTYDEVSDLMFNAVAMC